MEDPYNILSVSTTITDEHRVEMQERPISARATYTEEQFKVRQDIGKILTKLTYENAVEQGQPNLAKGYLTHPPYLFYTNDTGTIKKRIYGMCMDESGDLRAHTVCAMTMINNVTLGGTPLSELVTQDKWTDEQYNHLTSGLITESGAFTDPLGFCIFAE